MNRVRLLFVFIISFCIHLILSISLPILMFAFGNRFIIVELLDKPFQYEIFIEKMPWESILILNSLIFSFLITLIFILLKKFIR